MSAGVASRSTASRTFSQTSMYVDHSELLGDTLAADEFEQHHVPEATTRPQSSVIG